MLLHCVFISRQLINGKSVCEKKDDTSNICERIMNPDILAVDDSSCVGPKIFLPPFLEALEEVQW
jgi:hypothetical protein